MIILYNLTWEYVCVAFYFAGQLFFFFDRPETKAILRISGSQYISTIKAKSANITQFLFPILVV